MTIRYTDWGKTPEGRKVSLFTLTGPDGMEAAISTYGATLVSLKVPDKKGRLADIVLGYDNLEDYVHAPYYFGNTIGRFAGRIAGACLDLDGESYALSRNHAKHHIHGGNSGFDRKVWAARTVCKPEHAELTLCYESKHMEEGYPGTLKTSVIYSLANAGALMIEFKAQTDYPTIFNPTNHTYFNLHGPDSSDCLEQVLTLRASHFLVLDDESIPTGEIRSVFGTPFDFRAPVPIGKRIKERNSQLIRADGYDHFFIFDAGQSKSGWSARAYDPASGRELTMYTTQPGVQFYTGNYIKNGSKGKTGLTYGPRSGFCLEAQGYPDAPNHHNFPSVRLLPGEQYRHTTRFVFAVV